MKNLKILTIVAVLCCYCGGGAYAQKQKTQAANDTAYLFLFQPDHKMTVEQLDLKYRVGELIVDKVVVENNRVKSNVSLSDFRKVGLPDALYAMLLRNMDDMNHYFELNGIKNVDQVVVAAKKDFARTLAKRKKSKK